MWPPESLVESLVEPVLDLLAFCCSQVQSSPNVLPGKAAKWAVAFSQTRALLMQTRALWAVFDALLPCLPSQMSTKFPAPDTHRRSEPQPLSRVWNVQLTRGQAALGCQPVPSLPPPLRAGAPLAFHASVALGPFIAVSVMLGLFPVPCSLCKCSPASVLPRCCLCERKLTLTRARVSLARPRSH